MLKKFSRILVVDDSVTMRKLVSGMLSGLGFENVHEARDGRSALSLLGEQRFALVISDWNMAPMNGLELLSELQRLSPHTTVPFIMMTAHAVRFSTIARDNGAIHYLIKPFKSEQLAAKMLQATIVAAA